MAVYLVGKPIPAIVTAGRCPDENAIQMPLTSDILRTNEGQDAHTGRIVIATQNQIRNGQSQRLALIVILGEVNTQEDPATAGFQLDIAEGLNIAGRRCSPINTGVYTARSIVGSSQPTQCRQRLGCTLRNNGITAEEASKDLSGCGYRGAMTTRI